MRGNDPTPDLDLHWVTLSSSRTSRSRFNAEALSQINKPNTYIMVQDSLSLIVLPGQQRVTGICRGRHLLSDRGQDENDNLRLDEKRLLDAACA